MKDFYHFITNIKELLQNTNNYFKNISNLDASIKNLINNIKKDTKIVIAIAVITIIFNGIFTIYTIQENIKIQKNKDISLIRACLLEFTNNINEITKINNMKHLLRKNQISQSGISTICIDEVIKNSIVNDKELNLMLMQVRIYFTNINEKNNFRKFSESLAIANYDDFYNYINFNSSDYKYISNVMKDLSKYYELNK